MPATKPDQTPAPHPAPSTASAGLEQTAWMRWYKRLLKRMALWLGVSAVGAYAMGSAANHFLAGGARDQSASVSGTSNPSSAGASQHGMWWNPVTASIDASTKDSGVKVGPAASSPSSSNGGSFNGHSVILVERSAAFSSGS